MLERPGGNHSKKALVRDQEAREGKKGRGSVEQEWKAENKEPEHLFAFTKTWFPNAPLDPWDSNGEGQKNQLLLRMGVNLSPQQQEHGICSERPLAKEQQSLSTSPRAWLVVGRSRGTQK